MSVQHINNASLHSHVIPPVINLIVNDACGEQSTTKPSSCSMAVPGGKEGVECEWQGKATWSRSSKGVPGTCFWVRLSLSLSLSLTVCLCFLYHRAALFVVHRITPLAVGLVRAHSSQITLWRLPTCTILSPWFQHCVLHRFIHTPFVDSTLHLKQFTYPCKRLHFFFPH